MNLLVDVARWLASKALAIVVIAAVLTLAALAWSWAGEQRGLRTRIASLRIEVEAAERDWRTNRVRLLDTERVLHQLENERPNPILHPSDFLAWRTRVQAAEAAVEASRNARDRAYALLGEGRARLAGLESRIDDTYQELLKAALRTWQTIAIAVAAFLFGPILWAAFWFYGLAPLAERARPLRLCPASTPGSCRVAASGKVIEVRIEPGFPLVTRMDWLQQYAPGLTKRTRFLFDWRSPFTSYASGLREMTEIRVRTRPEATPGSSLSPVPAPALAANPASAADPEPASNPNPAPNPALPPPSPVPSPQADPSDTSECRVSLTSASDPNAYLLALELRDHPGIVLHPGVVVAVSGDIRMIARWRWRSLHGWIAGRLRHLLFAGTGTLYISGHGGVDLVGAAVPVVIEEALVLGADSRSEFATVRTETFWPYFRGRTSLFDYRFASGQAFLRQTASPPSARANANPFSRTLDAILNGVGKLLGF